MTAPDETQARPVVVVSGTDRERPMLEVLLAELRTFTMVDHAHARVVPIDSLPEQRWHPGCRWALVLDGWTRRYSDTELTMGTLGQVRLAAEFFVKAWLHRERQEQACQEAQERAVLEKFAAERVIRVRRPGTRTWCYVHRPRRKAHASVLWCHRTDATVFKDEAEARRYGTSHLAPLAGHQTGYFSDVAWDDFFEVVPADEVPGTWLL